MSGVGQDRWEAGMRTMAARDLHRAPERSQFYDEVAKTALTFFQLSGKLLDVGCGSGWAERHIFPVDYHGIDPAIKEPTERLKKGFAEKLPYADDSFDSVLCYSVLQHVADPEASLAEMRRVLRVGGHVGLLICVESDDEIFLNKWTLRQACKLVWDHFFMVDMKVVPGFYPPDGFYLMIAGVKV